MKKRKKLLLLLAVFAALLAAYFLIQHLVKSSEEETREETKSLISETTAEIDKVAFHSSDGEISLTKKENEWKLDGDDTFDVDEDAFNAKVTSLTGIGITAKLTDAEELSEYGLETPSNAITVTNTDGTATVIHVGGKNTSTGDYYVYLNDRADIIYTISTDLDTAFGIGLEDLRHVETETAEEKTE